MGGRTGALFAQGLLLQSKPSLLVLHKWIDHPRTAQHLRGADSRDICILGTLALLRVRACCSAPASVRTEHCDIRPSGHEFCRSEVSVPIVRHGHSIAPSGHILGAYARGMPEWVKP